MQRSACPAFWRALGGVVLAGCVYAGWDHQRIEAIFAPAAGAGPLEARIAAGQRSLLFGHHADYAAVTSAEPDGIAFDAFGRPLHRLIDARLMSAYAEALHARGETERALYAAQRLREFRRADAQAFFAVCEDAAEPPWQCDTRAVDLDWRRVRSSGASSR